MIGLKQARLHAGSAQRPMRYGIVYARTTRSTVAMGVKAVEARGWVPAWTGSEKAFGVKRHSVSDHLTNRTDTIFPDHLTNRTDTIFPKRHSVSDHLTNRTDTIFPQN